MLRRCAVWLLSVLLVFWFAFDRAAARPGGGQSYRSSSRSSSSGSRSYSGSSSSSSRSYSSPSSSSSSSRSYPSSSSTRSYGSSSGSSTTVVYTGSGSSSGSGWIIPIVIILVILLLIWLASRNKKPERAKIAVDESLAKAGLAELRKHDPEFEPMSFLSRTKTVVAKVNEAWLSGTMGPARRVISDGVYVRFSTQLELLRAQGLRNMMADWRVVSADLLAAVADQQWDTVHVKIVGEARDRDVAVTLSPSEALAQTKKAELSQYHEVWSFVRRRGKHSKKGIPALEGKCPSCGADLPLGEVVKCEYCKALVNSGEHDWVLAEITQPEEWRADPAVGEISGLSELRERDVSVSRQEIEDRASVIFWKWIEAKATKKHDKLNRFCVSPPSSPSEVAELELGPAQLSQVAVGSAELESVLTGGEQDYAYVEIMWSASVDGKEPQSFTHVFALGRSANAKSRNGLSSLDCSECGGPLAGSDAVTCQYCGTRLSGGKREWALFAVEGGVADDGDEDTDE